MHFSLHFLPFFSTFDNIFLRINNKMFRVGAKTPGGSGNLKHTYTCILFFGLRPDFFLPYLLYKTTSVSVKLVNADFYSSLSKSLIYIKVYPGNSPLTYHLYILGLGVILILCAFVVFTTRCFMWSLTLLFVLMVLCPVLHCDNLAWGRESWSLCILCMCMFILHALLICLFLFLLASGVSWRLWLWHSLDFSFNFLICEICQLIYCRLFFLYS